MPPLILTVPGLLKDPVPARFCVPPAKLSVPALVNEAPVRSWVPTENVSAATLLTSNVPELVPLPWISRVPLWACTAPVLLNVQPEETVAVPAASGFLEQPGVVEHGQTAVKRIIPLHVESSAGLIVNPSASRGEAAATEDQWSPCC